MAKIPKKDLPAYVRRCYNAYRTATSSQREAEILRLRFYAGGDLQWRDEEIAKRKAQGRPWVTINKCKPAVDQIEGDIRLNPPGPQVHPVGGGADPQVADIKEGLIREVEFRSHARTAYATAGKYVAASGYGVIELESEFAGERSFAQRLKITSVEDPDMVFWDPKARMANRQDAMWAGKLRMYNRDEYMAQFGAGRRVLESRGLQSVRGWIADALGADTDMRWLNEWTGAGKGPYYVAEFYQVELEDDELILYSDRIARFKDEPVPAGITPLPGDEYRRKVSRRTICKYVVDAFEVLAETDWLGRLIPLFPVLGPEIWIENKLYRLSLISGALDANRALNYVATTATELAGLMPKAPFIGWEGQFEDPRWQNANSEIYAYLEVKPVFGAGPNGENVLLPAPQRNPWETPIQWLLALGTYFSDAIKAVTAIYDPSLGAQKGEQSGRAIEQLRSESNVGNYSYADNLHRAIGVMYQEIDYIHSKILDGPRAVTIVRPDSSHEIALINQMFDADGMDPKTGQKGKPNDITVGEYSTRVTAGPGWETRQEEAVEALTNFFKIAPQALAAPGVAAKFLRMIGSGNSQVEGMADLLAPPDNGEVSPQEMAQQLQQEQQKNQVLTMLVQKLQQAIQSKLPEIEARKWETAIKALTSLEVAKINASKDTDTAGADREASLLETIAGMAHDRAMQAAEHEQAKTMQAGQQAHEAGMADKNAAIAQEAAENEPESAGAQK